MRAIRAKKLEFFDPVAQKYYRDELLQISTPKSTKKTTRRNKGPNERNEATRNLCSGLLLPDSTRTRVGMNKNEE
jgi:hypothetical protein